MEKFPKTVIIHQKYVDGARVRCEDCMGIAHRAIKSDSIETWEVDFMDWDGVQQTYAFDKHNLEEIA